MTPKLVSSLIRGTPVWALQALASTWSQAGRDRHAVPYNAHFGAGLVSVTPGFTMTLFVTRYGLSAAVRVESELIGPESVASALALEERISNSAATKRVEQMNLIIQ